MLIPGIDVGFFEPEWLDNITNGHVWKGPKSENMAFNSSLIKDGR